MATVEQNVTERAVQQMEGQPVDDDDVEILVRAGIKLLGGSGGIDVIRNALNTSQDPGQVVGQFMAQLIMKMGEDVIEQMQIDPRAFLAKGGFLEEILDYIEQQLNLPAEFSDQVYSETVEMIKAIVSGKAQSANAPSADGAMPQPPQPPQGQAPMGIDSMGAM